jgi:hypothetical protein
MSGREDPPSITYVPKRQNKQTSATSPSSVHTAPIRHPPTAHLGHPVYIHSTQPPHTYEHLKREHGSVSSGSTESSRQPTPRPKVAPIQIYSPTFSLSSQAEEGSLETARSTRAYPNQYTRPSRSEMAEINAAYQYSQEDEDNPDDPKDHAIWVLVSCPSHILTDQCSHDIDLAVLTGSIVLPPRCFLYSHSTHPTTCPLTIKPLQVNLQLIKIYHSLHLSHP